MKTLIVFLALSLVLVSCDRASNSPEVQSEPGELLTEQQVQVIDLARAKLQERLLGVSRDQQLGPQQDHAGTQYISHPMRMDRTSYEASKDAYMRYSSGVYASKPRILSCVNLTDPDPDSSLLKTDLYTRPSQEVLQVAQTLSDPKEIADFVRYDIKNEVLFGATRTASRTLRNRSGSSVDKANLLVAMLRATEVPAYFVIGDVYLSNSAAKRVFKVKEVSSLFSAMYQLFSSYFATAGSAGGEIYRMINGDTYWVVPHIWVRAYHDGRWQSYDPTELSDIFDLQGTAGTLTNTDRPDWKAWFFLPDSKGNYLKPRSYVDHLLQSFAPKQSIQTLNLTDSFVYEERVDGVLGRVPPCISKILNGLENSDLEFRGGISVTDAATGALKLSYQAPLAVFSENLSFLSHSSGLLSEVATPTSGDVEFRIGDKIVSSFSALSGTEYRISAFLNGSSLWSGRAFSDEFASNYKAGNVFHLNLYGGSAAPVDLSRGVEEVLRGINANVNSRFIMARLMRLAGLLFNLKSGRAAEDLVRLRGYLTVPITIDGTYTNGGGIVSAGQGDKEFGLVPLTGGIDARLPGYILSTPSDIYSEEGLLTAKIASEEDMIALSDAEATIWEELFGVRGYSANRVLQLGAKLKAQGQSYNLIDGLEFDADDNSHISSLIDPSSALYSHWPYIESTYGDHGGTFWSLNKEVTDPTGGAVSDGYIVFRKTIFDEGIAAFSVLNVGSPVLHATESGGVPASEDDSVLSSIASFVGLNSVLGTNQNDSRSGDQTVVRGGGSGKFAEPQLQVDDGKAFVGPQLPGAAPSLASCNPVSFSTGRMWHTLTDFNLRGRTENTRLKFQRTYFTLPQYADANSWVGQGDFGRGWVHTYDTRLLDGTKNSTTKLLTMGPLTSATLNIVWVSSEGNPILFDNIGTVSSPVYKSPDGFTGSLVVTSNTYELTIKGNIKYTFKRDLNSNYNGRLISIDEPHGESIQLAYGSNGKLDAISTPLAGSLSITRDGNGRITQITNSKSQLTYLYTYSNGRLSSSTDFDGNTTRYEYNQGQVGTKAEGLLTAIVDSLERRIEFEYYQNGRVFREKDHGGSVQTYSYAPYLYQKYTRVTSPNGHTTEYRYDDEFRIVQIIYPDGGREFQEWNGQGQIDFKQDPLGNKTNFTYDSRGNQTGVKRPLDSGYRQTAFNQTFDVPSSITPLVGGQISFSLDPLTGDAIQITRSSSGTVLYQNFTYDSLGSLNSVTSNLGSYANVTNADGLTTFEFHSRNPQELSYDKRGRVIERRYKNGRMLRYAYDNYDRVTLITDTNGPSTANIYDKAGRLIETSRAAEGAKHTARFEYDDRDRMIASTNFGGERTEYKYDVVGVACNIQDKPTKIISPSGKVTRFEYDFAGRKTRVYLPGGEQISYHYNLRGDLVAVIDPRGMVTQYEYDSNGRVVRKLAQSAAARATSGGQQITYGGDDTFFYYDEADRIIRKEQKLLNESHMNGRYVTEFTYDDVDRLVQQKISHKRGTSVVEEFDRITYSYLNLLGTSLISYVGNKYVDLHFTYQNQPPYSLVAYRVVPTVSGVAIGLKESTFRVTPGINGAMAQIERQGAVLIKNGFDEAGRLLSSVVKLGSFSHSVGLVYDGLGRRTQITHSNGQQGFYSYDFNDRPVYLAWVGGGDEKLEVLSYDSDGLVTQALRETGEFYYKYSANNELTSIRYAGSETLNDADVNTSIAYDQGGNISSYRELSFNVFNNFTTAIGDTATYWPDNSGLGRIIGESKGGDVKSLNYYPDGKLRELALYTNGSLQRKVTYYYDGLGRRIAKVKNFTSESGSEITYTHLGLEDRILVADVTKDGNTTESIYIDGAGIDDHLFEINAATGAKIYAKDHLGSVLFSTAAGGKSVYGVFGEPLGTAPPTNSATEPVVYAFTGREYDTESGYYYYRARYYDPVSARFLTKDPLGPEAGGDVNPYRYVGNNPVNFRDPTGLTQEDVNRAIQIVSPYINMGNTSIRYTNMSGEVEGQGIPATPFTSPTIFLDQSVLGPLDTDGREQLLNTMFHEGFHTQQTWSGIFTDMIQPNVPGTNTTPAHYDIYRRAGQLTDSYGSMMNSNRPITTCPR